MIEGHVVEKNDVRFRRECNFELFERVYFHFDREPLRAGREKARQGDGKIAEADLPKTYGELLSPKWKGQLVMRSPLGGNSPAFFVQFIEQKHGGLDWFRKFGANIPMIADNGTAVHEIIQNGKRPLALSRDVEVISYNAKTKGKKLKYIFIQYFFTPT